jgi:hypothetical protein
MPGLTKTLVAFGETTTERLGFCCLVLFMTRLLYARVENSAGAASTGLVKELRIFWLAEGK